jgi:hypothetical protein
LGKLHFGGNVNGNTTRWYWHTKMQALLSTVLAVMDLLVVVVVVLLLLLLRP